MKTTNAVRASFTLGTTGLNSFFIAAIDAFVPLLENNRAEFEKVYKETFTYGDLTRHQVNKFLDIFLPC